MSKLITHTPLKNGLTMRSLEVFLAVVKTQSFGLAAQALAISQPSVSVHVQSLERKLGTQLFIRHPGQAPKLSETAHSLLAYAQEVLSQTQVLQESLSRGKKQLRIGAQRFVTQALLGSAFEALSEALREVEVIVRTGTFEEVSDLYLRKEVDLAFFLTPKDSLHPWTYHPIAQYRLALIAHPSHPLAKARALKPQRLDQYAFVVAFKQSYFFKSIDALLNAHQVRIRQVAAQAEDAATLREMVKAGMGLAFTLLHSVKGEIDQGRLVEIDLDVPAMYLQLGYARHVTPVSADIDALLERMKNSLETLKYKSMDPS
jgi:LysR family transcriptional regulator, low CO2-responsive transcriptional regulator